MNDNDTADPKLRSDPFGMGLAAHRDLFPRENCPYPPAFVEARRWLAGWDHAELRAVNSRG